MKNKKRFKIRKLLFLIFFIYIISTLVIQEFKFAELAKQETELAEKLKEAKEQREILKKEISLLHTDEYIERIARDELGLVKPGEYIFKWANSPKSDD